MIRIHCPSCKAALNVELRLAGTSQECPGCAETIQIPEVKQGVTSEQEPAETQNTVVPDAEFDPMDILGEASEPSAGPSVFVPTEDVPVDDEAASLPTQPTPAPVPETGTAAAATDAMNQMRSVPLPTQPSGLAASTPDEPTQPIGDEIREAFSSADKFFDMLGRRKLYVTLIATMFVALIAFMPKGCSDRVPVYPVAGRVVFPDGSPVKTGIVEFESVEHGTASTGRIDDNGNFVLRTYTPSDGAPAGSHKAIVFQMVISDGTIKHEKDHGLPVKYMYRNYDTSGLKFEIEPQENKLTITVEPEVDTGNFQE
jgi:hypothetical protein